MMGCGGSRGCGCVNFKHKSVKYDEDSTSSCRSSDASEAQVRDIRRRKLPGEGGFMRILSPRNLFKGWRKNEELSMTKVERTMKAAILIQRWYRRYLARMEVRRRYTWTIFQSIEYAGEQDQVKLYNFFNALLTHMPDSSNKTFGSGATSKSSSIEEATTVVVPIIPPPPSTDSPEPDEDDEYTVDMKYEDESDDMEEDGMQSVDRDYRGIHINFPMKRPDLDSLIETFRKKKQQRLHARYVAGILKESIAKLKRLPNLNQASTAISKQVTICGDLHGKLDDLLVIFHKNGLPSPENPYVFNGDFVDRGKKGLEVFLLLLSCMLVFPGGVFLNRGNHEDHIMNARYGFIREVHQKYRHNAERLLKLIEGVYRWLPLGTIVNNKVLIVHGGISDTTDLDLIKSLDRGKVYYLIVTASTIRKEISNNVKQYTKSARRNENNFQIKLETMHHIDVKGQARFKYVSLLRPPITESSAPGAEMIDKVEWKQVFDILWSDPQPSEGCIPNALRGAGTYFGPDVTRKFLKRNKLMYLVRSHECKPDGYELLHNGKVITIFSASNYYELGSNKGAYLKLVGPQLATHFVQYTSAISKTKRLTFRQRVGLVESSAIRELSAQILSSRAELEAEFKKYDPDNTLLITVTEWCKAMEDATQLNLPWRMLRDKLVTLDLETNKVMYMTTFEGFESEIINSHAGSTTVVETLYRNKSSLEAIFRIIDKDNSGYISLEEFSDACNLLRQHMPNPITQEQLVDICRLMDMNKDGLVDLNEFLETFRLVDIDHERRDDADSAKTPPKSPVLSPRTGD